MTEEEEQNWHVAELAAARVYALIMSHFQDLCYSDNEYGPEIRFKKEDELFKKIITLLVTERIGDTRSSLAAAKKNIDEVIEEFVEEIKEFTSDAFDELRPKK